MKKIGLFGGAFNPIHIGHLKMAEAARKEYKLDIVYFIPCGIPSHKPKKDLLPATLRMKLLKETITGKKYFKILDIEIKKKKPCYTVDTVKELMNKKNSILPPEARLAKGGNTQYSILFFLIGQDEFENLHKWKRHKQLVKLIIFLVLPRRSKKIKAPKIKGLEWQLVHAKPVNVSSTEIRKSGRYL